LSRTMSSGEGRSGIRSMEARSEFLAALGG
jgi:hypothetical protein